MRTATAHTVLRTAARWLWAPILHAIIAWQVIVGGDETPLPCVPQPDSGSSLMRELLLRLEIGNALLLLTVVLVAMRRRRETRAIATDVLWWFVTLMVVFFATATMLEPSGPAGPLVNEDCLW